MKINRAREFGIWAGRGRYALWVAVMATLASCTPPRMVPQSAPLPPPPARNPAPAPRPQPPAPVADWRDAAQTPGTWTYRAEGQGSAALYGTAGTLPLLVLRCDRARATVTVLRSGSAPSPVPMTILTTSTLRPLSATPVPATGDNAGALAVGLTARDPLLDAMAYSRGRFAVETNGLPTLYLPAWAEIGRVIEDCR